MAYEHKKTALVLSGGGSRGAYEAGVWQALAETGTGIDIVTGASVGAINGAMVCQGDLEATIALWREIETHMVFDVPEGGQPLDYAREVILRGGVSAGGLKKLLEKYIDEDRVRRSPVEYGLVVVEKLGLKPHRLFRDDIPRGRLIDYIMASSSVFPALHAYEIDGRDYIDGGYADVLPVGMALAKGAGRVIAVKLNALGILNSQPLKEAPDLTVIESKWELGSTLIFDVHNSRRIMRLGYLEAMKALDVFAGSYYTFAAGAFGKADVKLADAAAYVFGLDPALIYTRELFLEKLAAVCLPARKQLEGTIAGFKRDPLNIPGTAGLIRRLRELSNAQIICFLIADNLKEKGAGSLFLSRSLVRLFSQQLAAARFLVKYDLA